MDRTCQQKASNMGVLQVGYNEVEYHNQQCKTKSYVGQACIGCNGSTICMNRKLQPDSNVLRMHILHIMKGSYASIIAQSQ